jgi:predicted RNA binding protein YcfA (HicA-like mRNA interferase family)
MKVPRNVYGRELADLLIRSWGYYESHQTGSHIIPAHRGTLRTDYADS